MWVQSGGGLGQLQEDLCLLIGLVSGLERLKDFLNICISNVSVLHGDFRITVFLHVGQGPKGHIYREGPG
jgi:hypothetical protein